MNPRLALVAGGKLDIGDAFGGAGRQRPRQCLAELWRPHRGKRADLALAVAFKIAGEAAQAGERAHQRAAADPVGAARGEEGAHVSRRQCREFLQRRRAAEMLGEEDEELHNVSPIGFKRLRRITALVAEMAEPTLDLGSDFGGHKFSSPVGAGEGDRSEGGGRGVGDEDSLQAACPLHHASHGPPPPLRYAPRGRMKGYATLTLASPPFPLPKPPGIGTT